MGILGVLAWLIEQLAQKLRNYKTPLCRLAGDTRPLRQPVQLLGGQSWGRFLYPPSKQRGKRLRQSQHSTRPPSPLLHESKSSSHIPPRSSSIMRHTSLCLVGRLMSVQYTTPCSWKRKGYDEVGPQIFEPWHPERITDLKSGLAPLHTQAQVAFLA